jgi:serralysin
MTVLTDSVDWGAQLSSNVVSFTFAPEGETYWAPDGGTTQSYQWTAYEIAQFKKAFALFESFTDLKFVQAQNPSAADFTLVRYFDWDTGVLAAMGPPDTEIAGLGMFNAAGLGWDYDPSYHGLKQGGFGFTTIIHELGHGLGLAHPHDTGGSSSIMPGVSAPDDLGTYNLNQGVYTMMSYNAGWKKAPQGLPQTGDYGWTGTPMAIDIAVLQAKYGADMGHRTGNDVYRLPGVNAVGTFYSCIWDAGGTDTISAGGVTGNAAINLNDASLRVELGGGGWISSVSPDPWRLHHRQRRGDRKRYRRIRQ